MLPKHPEVGTLSRGIERAALIAAPALLLLLATMRVAHPAPFDLATPALLLLGVFAADLVSGLVHWGADTWGRQDWPLVGERLIAPFRVHHVNPRDICARDMVDLNGDIAVLALPLLVWALGWPLEAVASRHALEFTLAFVAFTLPTNLIHRWAHAGREAPALARLLQRSGLILSPRHHHAHHRAPFDRDYCIVNGWCNPLLRALGFWRGCERLIAGLTGAVPRCDDAALYCATFKGSPRSPVRSAAGSSG